MDRRRFLTTLAALPFAAPLLRLLKPTPVLAAPLEELPPGWERAQDYGGTFEVYRHLPSGFGFWKRGPGEPWKAGRWVMEYEDRAVEWGVTDEIQFFAERDEAFSCCLTLCEGRFGFHSSLSGTTTGRISCSSPNYANLPRADYSTVEAHQSCYTPGILDEKQSERFIELVKEQSALVPNVKVEPLVPAIVVNGSPISEESRLKIERFVFENMNGPYKKVLVLEDEGLTGLEVRMLDGTVSLEERTFERQQSDDNEDFHAWAERVAKG